MEISIELSLYPLTKEYGPPILDFIEKLKGYDGIEVKTNTMSTQVFGSYEMIMDLLKRELKEVFEQDKTSVIVMKMVNENLIS